MIRSPYDDQFDDYSEFVWCKVMDVNTGSVGDTIQNCSSYDQHTRDRASADTDPTDTSVVCYDNCDSVSARCTITRDGNTYSIPSVTYNEHDVVNDGIAIPCTTEPIAITTFTLNSMDTTVIVFASNAVSVAFDAVGESHSVYDVVQEGNAWSGLNPSDPFGDSSPDIFSEVGVIQIALPCCLCYGHSTNVFEIGTDDDTMIQTINITQLGHGGSVDNEQSRVIGLGLGFPKGLSVWSVSSGKAKASYLEPDLCDAYATCLVSPCGTKKCPAVPGAECVEDYCGGCFDRWYDGYEDVTSVCGSPVATFSTTPIPVAVSGVEGIGSAMIAFVAMAVMVILQ